MRGSSTHPWQGLGRSHAKYSALDDTPSEDTWWTAIGATAYSSPKHFQFKEDCIPGPLPHLVTKVELYISGAINHNTYILLCLIF